MSRWVRGITSVISRQIACDVAAHDSFIGQCICQEERRCACFSAFCLLQSIKAEVMARLKAVRVPAISGAYALAVNRYHCLYNLKIRGISVRGGSVTISFIHSRNDYRSSRRHAKTSPPGWNDARRLGTLLQHHLPSRP
jgi:hypothetical protein